MKEFEAFVSWKLPEINGTLLNVNNEFAVPASIKLSRVLGNDVKEYVRDKVREILLDVDMQDKNINTLVMKIRVEPEITLEHREFEDGKAEEFK